MMMGDVHSVVLSVGLELSAVGGRGLGDLRRVECMDAANVRARVVHLKPFLQI